MNPHRSRPSPPTDLKLAEFRHRDRDRVENISLRNGCDPGPVSTAVADGVERFAWPCPPGAEVELVVTDGDGHTWPGSPAQQEWVSFLGPVTMEIDATQVIWAFFEEHAMPDQPPGAALAACARAVTTRPNPLLMAIRVAPIDARARIMCSGRR